MIRRALPLAAALLAGCSVGPNYHAPEPAASAAFVGPQPPGAEVDLARWWQVFGDPTLTDLVERALRQSPDIETAASRVRQARLNEVIAGAANKPTIDAMASATHIHFSKNAGLSNLASAFGGGGGGAGGAAGGAGGAGGGGSAGGGNQGIALPGDGITTYAVGFDASWELDLFGGGRRQVEGARARTEAAVWSGRDAAVTLAAEIATTYFQLRLDQAQLAVIEGEIRAQNRALEVAAHQAQVGLVPQTDVTRQRGNLTATQARLEPIRADVDVQLHALAVLLGEQPGTLASLKTTPVTFARTPVIPAGLPSDLLRRRPDVRAAERNLAATSADIGVAVADQYPRFSLTGVAELISTALGNLFTPDSFQLTATGQAMFPLLDWGRRGATVGVRKEERVQAYIQYRQAVLGALRDVEDPLSRLDAERRRNAALARAVADQTASRDAISAQYRTGFVAQDALMNAEADLLAAREQLAQSDTQLRQYTVALFKALGGGWETADAISPPGGARPDDSVLEEKKD